MKIKFLSLAFFLCATMAQASVLIKQQDIDLKGALSAIAKDMQVKLINDLDDKIQRQVLTQTLSGEGPELLRQLSDVYDFDWYVYGGILTVEAGQKYVNYAYKPRNISSQALLKELKQTFDTNLTTKLKLTERKNSILFSGTRKFVNDAVSYANMVDKNQFLENGNNLELARIEFHFISVIDRSVSTFDSTVTFPGAQALIAAAITNIGQFQNVSDGEIVQRTYKVKLSEGEKQQLDEEEKTSNVQALPAANALLVRGTPEEIKLAKRIAALIDVKRQQLLFSLKVYDVAADRNENFGIDSAWLSGVKGIYDIVIPPFTQTTEFLKNFQALSSNGIARGVYQTNLLVLENQKGHFGKKETATITLISERQVETQKIEADNSLYVTGRLLPSGNVQAKVEYIEESLGDTADSESTKSEPPRVSSQSLETEVYIKPNQTVILGGFDNTVTQSSTNAVPVLSSIPFLGELFKSTSQTKRKFKRYVSISFEVIE
ncbi:secretin [Vibrio cholerae]|uniref:secretin N-terminal domain-containing protein n=1 Tax=Vibrio cholerae TaxID=666 RepID=UPI00157AF6A9|nr:secretin N-terminal domain-containing protein [Vibrio cholerae]EGQ8095624.1 secretin [Vibrio cholerae]EGQ9189294.1 secretin [Vibrio cholerae]EGR0593617.1 secretin [Vibrio cholerae]EKF9603486.1 secretin [Vibrio cholerae]ELV5028125.1 secretin [Vibrio cholerae]